mgnify:FL=1|tara:strand:+ start:401 stop:856 length:456 start_codon:yes stop_codon:yes gene_type:complete
MKKLLTILSVLTIYSSVSASELTFGFKSPSFNGVGQSSHYLTIENIEKTRKDAIIAKNKANAKALKDEINGTAVAKFKANLEARFYTALAKQITDNVFGADGLQQDSGTFTGTNGETVAWVTPANTGNVVVTVTEADGTVTTFTMPKEDNS